MVETCGVNMILITGSARSGTSWLGKIFDSHPSVIYRHEPDTAEPCYDIPFMLEAEDVSYYKDRAEAYLQQLCRVRCVRSIGRPPQFRKSYLRRSGMWVRVGIIAALRAASGVPILGEGVSKLNTPDLIEPEAGELRYVIKSVVSLGRVGLYRKALPEGRIVHIVRHPCGFAASQLRGQSLGKISYEPPFQQMCASSTGRRYDLTPQRLKSMSREEQLAWIWVVFNEKAHDDLADAPNAITIKHEALCSEPIEEARKLYAFCGLTWSRQTEEFLREGPASTRSLGYFDVRRNPARELDKWKEELSSEAIQRIEGVLSRTRVGMLYA